MPENFSRNQLILRFDVILLHDWPIEQCLLHIRVVFGGKTKSSCFDRFIHWLIKQIQLTPENSNLQAKSKKVRVIGSSKKIAGSKEKNSFYCIVNILITFNCRNVK